MSSENDLEARLRRHVEVLAEIIGERNTAHPANLEAARKYMKQELESLGLSVIEQPHRNSVRDAINYEVVLRGTDSRKRPLIIGAHYDSAPGTPGADDNASAVAILLEIVRAYSRIKLRRTIRCVFYDCEEPPHFNTYEMGSEYHAAACRKVGEQLFGMLCLESLGYFPKQPCPARDLGRVPWYLNAFNWIVGGRNVAIVSNLQSIPLWLRFLWVFATSGFFPFIPAAAPRRVQVIEYSDHRGYWNEGYRALMVTNTALLRNPNYHEKTDRLGTLDLPRMARLCAQLVRCVKRL